MVSMGAYICIFPDKLFYNTADAADYGCMEAYYSSTGTVNCTLCRMDGTEYETPRVSDSPESCAGKRRTLDRQLRRHGYPETVEPGKPVLDGDKQCVHQDALRIPGRTAGTF